MTLLDVVLARATGRDVRLTMVDGITRYRDGALQTVDRADVEAAVRATAAASREPLDSGLAALVPELQAPLRRHYAALTRGTA